MSKPVPKIVTKLVDEACTAGTLSICEQVCTHGFGVTLAALAGGSLAGGIGALALPAGFMLMNARKGGTAGGLTEAQIKEEFGELKRLLQLANDGNADIRFQLSQRLVENGAVDARLPGYEKADLTAYIEAKLVPKVNEIAESLGMRIEEGLDGLRIYHQSHGLKLDKVLTKVERQNELLQRVVDDYMARNANLEQDNSALRQQVEHAVQRLADAEAKAGRDPMVRLQELREGHPDDLKAFLIDETERDEIDLINKHRELAAVSYVTGDLVQAMKSVGTILALHSDDLDAINTKGHIHHTRGELDDAKAAYERTLTLAGDNKDAQAAAYGNLGNILRIRGELEGAMAAYERVLLLTGDSAPDKACAYGNLGIVLATRGDLDGAEAMHRKALALNERLGLPEGMAINSGNLGNVLYTRGDLDGAESMYRKALEIFEQRRHAKGKATIYGYLGDVLFTRGDLDGAEAMLRKALELNERLGRIEGMAINYGNLGNVLLTRGDLDGAEAMYRKALELYERLGHIEGMATIYGYLGNVLSTRGDLDGAEAMYRKSLELNERLGRPEGMASAHGSLGNVLKTRGDLNGAEAMYRKALELNERLGRPEGMASAHGSLGNVLLIRGDLDGAEAMHRKALELNERLGRPEGMASAHGSLGNVLLIRGDLDGAEDMYRKALELNERLGRIAGMAIQYGNLGIVLSTRGDLDGAEAMYRKALELNERLGRIEGMAHVYDSLGTLLCSRGDLKEAESMYGQALECWNNLVGESHPNAMRVRCRLSTVRSQQTGGPPPLEELIEALRTVLAQRPAASEIPVIIGRLLRTAGGDPIAIVTELEGEDAAKKYAEILDSDWYPDGPRKPPPQ